MTNSVNERIRLLDEFIARSDALVKWLTEHGTTCMIPNEERSRLAASCFYIALEHHESIVLMASHRYWASASAMVRPMCEACVKGLWIYHHASPAELEKLVKKGKYPKDVPDMVKEIEDSEEKDKTVLTLIKSKLWSAMCDYVHTGMVQLSRCYKGKKIQPKFTIKEVTGMLMLVNWLGSLVGRSTNTAFGSTNDVDKFEDNLTGYLNHLEATAHSLSSKPSTKN